MSNLKLAKIIYESNEILPKTKLIMIKNLRENSVNEGILTWKHWVAIGAGVGVVGLLSLIQARMAFKEDERELDKNYLKCKDSCQKIIRNIHQVSQVEYAEDEKDRLKERYMECINKCRQSFDSKKKVLKAKKEKVNKQISSKIQEIKKRKAEQKNKKK